MLVQGARACQIILGPSRRAGQRWVECGAEQIGGGSRGFGGSWPLVQHTVGDAGFCFAANCIIRTECFSNRAAVVQRGINSRKFVLCSRSI